MSSRTTHSIVHFAAPFVLTGFDRAQPAGDYDVDNDEELIDGLSWQAWRRVATYIHLPARATKSALKQIVAIDPAELEAALRQDQGTTQ